MTDLSTYLDVVRDRLAECSKDPSYNEHDDCHLDLARLVRLVGVAQEIVDLVEGIVGIAGIGEGQRNCPECARVSRLASDALARWQAVVEEYESGAIRATLGGTG